MVYDFIIIGAGSAGNVLLPSLTEDPEVTVLLLGSWRSDRFDFRTNASGISLSVVGRRYNWAYETEPEPI